MMKELFFVFWFFVPAGVANISAFLAGIIPFLKPYNYPVDFKKTFRGRRILGSNKTIRGFIAGIIVAIIITYLQKLLYQNFESIRNLIHLDYNLINPVIFGILAGFGSLFGDSFKSLFKRRVTISPGSSWFPFDQIDYIIGGIMFTAFYVRLQIGEYIILFLLWFVLHLLTNFLGYFLRIKKTPL